MSLQTADLVKTYRGRNVVDGVSIEVQSGEVVGLLGPNGAGKTTTFYMVVGLVQPDAGKVLLDGEDLSHVPMHGRARRGIGYLPQEPSVFRRLTVEDNLRLILEMQPIAREEQAARAERLMRKLGIKELRHSKGMVLSGGERRRVEIARALAWTRLRWTRSRGSSPICDPMASGSLSRTTACARRWRSRTAPTSSTMGGF
jgi:lipopolysaccharide export system ATP-binding protein